MAGTNNYKVWAQNVVPIVFDDYITQKDLFVKIVRYINGLIGDVQTISNEFAEFDTGTIGDLTDLHTTEKDSIVGAINEIEDDVETLKTDKLDAPAVAGTSGQVLVSDGEGGQAWGSIAAGEVVIDDTLTIEGAAADAKKTGDEITSIKTDLTNIYEVEIGENVCNPGTEVTGGIKTNGDIDATLTAYKTTDYFPVKSNTNYTFSSFASNGTISTSRKYVALYDENHAYISGTQQNVTNTDHVNFASGSAKYARVACEAVYDKMVVEGTNTPHAYFQYEEHNVSKLELSDATKETFIETTLINLYDANEASVGVLNSVGALDSSGTSYVTSDFIKVENGYKYSIEPECRKIYLYWTNKQSTAISGSYVDVPDNSPQIVTPAQDCYLRFSVNNAVTGVTVKKLYIGTATKKAEEGISLSEYQKGQVSDMIDANGLQSILTGKKWTVCGDSFTNSGGTETLMPAGTKYAGKPYTYPWIIGSRQNMDIVKFFEGGRTLAFPATPGTFANSITNPSATWYYQNIPADTDYITIYLGINDEHHAPSGSSGDGEDTTGEIPLGTVSDSTTATYLGAWNVVLTWLITNRPNAHIGIIVTNGIAGNDAYRQGQIAIAEKYGIPYIDLNGDARTPAMLRTSNPNIPAAIKTALINKWAVDPSSNTHPNDAAQLFESTFIENFLKSI